MIFVEMYSKDGQQIGFARPNGENWSENGQWPTAISSSESDEYMCLLKYVTV